MNTEQLIQRIRDRDVRIAVIGLGYVGLPLAAEFGQTFEVIGFDINERRLHELQQGQDSTRELSAEQLRLAKRLSFTNRVEDIRGSDFFIVTVPTPIDAHRRPDLTPLIAASKTVSVALAPGSIVIYESTVYPGCTEEDCVPILEEGSGLKYNQDFFGGYSPERINPGDKEHTVTTIQKVTAGSTPAVGRVVDELYRTVITAGTHLASSIAEAEAAKVIENAQRDINIAFVNELSMIFERMGLDTQGVLEAAGTKWNFLPFRPGLVGGHCIGVDPYYLTHKAEALGYHPQMILAGRRLNDNMGAHVAYRVIKLMIKKGHRIQGSRVLILGITFKENCPDIRNSRVPDVIREMCDVGCTVDVHDPWADAAEVKSEYGLDLVSDAALGAYDAVILAVAHREYGALDLSLCDRARTVLFDIKGKLPKDFVDGRL